MDMDAIFRPMIDTLFSQTDFDLKGVLGSTNRGIVPGGGQGDLTRDNQTVRTNTTPSHIAEQLLFWTEC